MDFFPFGVILKFTGLFLFATRVNSCEYLSSGYLLKEGMKVMDVVYAEYIGEERKAKAIARKLLAMGDSVEKICAATGLYKKQVLKLQNEDTEES